MTPPLRITLAAVLENIATIRDSYERGECPKEYAQDMEEKVLRLLGEYTSRAETVDVLLTAGILRGYSALAPGELHP